MAVPQQCHISVAERIEAGRVRMSAELTLLVAANAGVLDVSVLSRYSSLLDRAEAVGEQLLGGVTASAVVQSADDYRMWLTNDYQSGELFGDDGWAGNKLGSGGSAAVRRVAALNVGLMSGLDLGSLAHHCLYGVSLLRLLSDATEGAVSAPAAVRSLVALDERLRSDPEVSYVELATEYADRGLAIDLRSFIERWAKRRSFHSEARRVGRENLGYSATDHEVRDVVVGMWQTEKAAAKREKRKPVKAHVWADLIASKADSTNGTGDSEVVVVGGVRVAKMRFYQWLHRADR